MNPQWKQKGSRNTTRLDVFSNVVLEEAVDEKATDENGYIGQSVIRGNNIA